jgi:hypothetical protein
MTISIKPTASGSTIEQDGSAILSIDASGNLTVPNNMTFSGTVTGVSSYSDSDALSLFNASGSAPVYACRAWVNFNGTGTVAIRASGNVSSITDNGTGDYTVNFATAMPDTNYASVCGSSTLSGAALNYSFGPVDPSLTAPTTTSRRFVRESSSGSASDPANAEIAIFR